MRKWSTNQFVRALHVAVCLSLMLPLLLRPSVLHQMVIQREDVIHGSLYLGFFVAALCAYFIASYTDPGYLTHDKARLFRHRRGQSSERGDDSPPTEAHCQLAGPQQPLSIDTKHLTSHQPGGPNYFLAWPNFVHPARWMLVFHPFCRWSNNPTDQPTIVYNLSIPVRFCKHCLMEQPLRCRHCPDCGRCVMKFDHHCPWIANCVGERNHSAFAVFLALQTVVLWWTFYLASASIVPRYAWSDWFRANGLPFAEMLILGLVGIPLTVLLGFHLYLASASRTTWETLSYERIVYLKHLEDRINPFHQGYARNCYSFCCSRFPFGWDRIYAETVEKQFNTSPRSALTPDTVTVPRTEAELVILPNRLTSSIVEAQLNPV